MNPLAFLDLEIYRDYFLVGVRIDNEFHAFEMYDGHPLDVDALKAIIADRTVITFNGNHFDLPLLEIAMQPGAKCSQVKVFCDKIIVAGLKSWDIRRQSGAPVLDLDHVDLIEVAPGFSSLKIYAGRMHSPTMQDLPIAPDESIAPDDRDQIRRYCANDLAVTQRLYETLKPMIDLRVKLGQEYGLELRSRSDAQIAEAVIGHRIAALQKKESIPKPAKRVGEKFFYGMPSWIKFNTATLRTLKAAIADTEFEVGPTGSVTLPASLADCMITLHPSTYRLGIGGLHSTESCAAHLADEHTLLLDRDVASYYPSIILRLGLYPKQLGPDFIKVYRDIVETRLAAKHAGDKLTADVMKIMVNGTFGKFGSQYSILYAPDLMLQVTITGQLALLMLIERLHLTGIDVVSANTDGIVIKCPVAKAVECDAIIWKWEADTAFETEETQYRTLYSKDVNNYIALKVKGGAKLKGVYAGNSLAKNPNNQVVIDAVLAHLATGRSLRSYIMECNDSTRFTTIRAVKGGGIKDGEYLGKAVRWYYSTCCPGPITNMKGDAVARSEGGRPLMTLPDTLPSDIDYDWYINEARQILVDIGATKETHHVALMA